MGGSKGLTKDLNGGQYDIVWGYDIYHNTLKTIFINIFHNLLSKKVFLGRYSMFIVFFDYIFFYYPSCGLFSKVFK